MIKSPLRYPGGKSRAIKFLAPFLIPFKELREPFFGGGSVSFYAVQQYKKAQFFASDLNYDVYTFWEQLKVNTEEIITGVEQHKKTYTIGRELYDDILARRNEGLNNIQRAIDFFILNRITFSGTIDAGGFSNSAFEKRFTDSSIDRLKKAATIIQRINFSPTDFSYLLEKAGQKVLIFLDPPYYSVTKSRLYGKKGKFHTGFDHQRLYESLTTCSHPWLMTYDNCDFIKDTYKDFYQLDWELQYGMNNYKQKKAAKGKEILIANYDLQACLRKPQGILL